ncbi:MAG: efflux RND transporter permease subunit [Pseudomonadota bacterium]
MNLAEFSIKNRLICGLVIVASLIGGWVAYTTMPRFEDPEFTIRTAQVFTQYPGATPSEVADEVSEPIESALQEMQEVEEIRSVSKDGLSEIEVDIKFAFSPSKSDLQLVWTKLRNKVNDAQGSLPPGAGPSFVFDEFGDVYGFYYVITGAGYTADDLAEYGEQLRRELLRVPGVAKIGFSGTQSEAIYIEVSRARANALGVSLTNLYQTLATQNVVADAGRITLGERRITIMPTGELDSVAAIESLIIPTADSDNLISVRDIATVTRSYEDPASLLIRYNGEPALAMGVSTVSGSNVVAVGAALDAALEASIASRPLGMEVENFYHQGVIVDASVKDFVVNVGLALVIVLGTLLIFMGLRSALVIGGGLLLTIAATLLVMMMSDIPMHRISLGALIIALGMLVDNAIVVTEGILVGVQQGKKKLQLAIDVVKTSQWPLLGGTVVGILAFAPIGFAPGSTAEYTGHLFWVILISLLFSWLFSLTLTPLFCDLLFKEEEPSSEGQQTESRLAGAFKAVVRSAIRLRWLMAAAVVALFVTSLWSFQFVKSGFFPASTTPQIVVDYWLPEGTSIERTKDDMIALEEYSQGLDGVTDVQTLVGGGTLRYMLVYSFESQNSSYGQLLIRVDSFERIAELIPEIQARINSGPPDSYGKAWRFTQGPGGGAKIQATFLGPDPATLRGLANQAKAIMAADGRALSINDDWRQSLPVITPVYSNNKGRRLGVTREDMAGALLSTFSGEQVGVYREGDDLVPIISRAPEAERLSLENVWEVQVLSSTTGLMVPLAQVTDGIRLDWRDGQLRRENRIWAIKAQADPHPDELTSDLLNRIKPQIDAIELPTGYSLRWDGEYGDSAEANENLGGVIPLGFLAMLLVTILLFNGLRDPLAIWLVVPLSLIGVVVGLIVTGTPLEFMGILGLLSLSGLLIKNAIVLVDQINIEIGSRKPRFDAIVDSAAGRVRPVLMGSLTTVLGVMPLMGDAFFRSMAVVLIFGLTFATALTLVMVPVFYAMLFNVKTSETAAA